MNLLGYVSEVSQRAGLELTQKTNNDETVKVHLIRTFNMFHKDFNSRYPWPWRWKTASLQTIENYETGTVVVTNGSRTVTVSGGGTFTDAMEGRVFKLNRDTEFYQIKDVPNSSTLTLELPYIGNTGSGLGYLIWNKLYDLPPDVASIDDIYLWSWPYRTKPIPRKEFDSSFLNSHLAGYPEAWSYYGFNRVVSTYVEGTISSTVDSRTFTGSGTSWIGNIFPGTRVVVGVNTYNVETVDSDTQFTAVQNAMVTGSGATYTARTFNRPQIVLSSTPDPVLNLYITYPKKAYDFLNDNDEPEIIEGYEHILANVIYGYLLEKLTNKRAFSWLEIYESQMKDAWKSICDQDPQDTAVWIRNPYQSGYRRALYG